MFSSNSRKITRICCQFLVITAFILLSVNLVPYHEHWADEVQAMLIARDAHWTEILTKVPFQEGQPILWHLLLKICFYIFGENINISYISIGVMSLCIAVIIFGYDIPLIYKCLLPFSYYFLYQYNIVARNYCLSFLGLALVGLTYKDRHKKAWPYILSLAFLAETTSFYVPVVFVLACFYLYEIYFQYRIECKKYIFPVSFLMLVGMSILWQIFPLNYYSYIRRTRMELLPFFLGAFFSSGDILLSLFFLFFFAFGFIYKSPKLSSMYNTALILALWSIFIIVVIFISPRRQHQGLVFGLFLFTLYITKNNCTNFLFTTLLLIHLQWGVRAIKYEIEEINSPQQNVLTWLINHKLDNQKVFAVGYQTLPFIAIYPRQNLVISQNSPLYFVHTEDFHDQENNYHKLLKERHDIILIDAAPTYLLKNEYKHELNLFNYNNDYFKFVFRASLNEKGLPGYIQHLTLYVSKDLYLKR